MIRERASSGRQLDAVIREACATRVLRARYYAVSIQRLLELMKEAGSRGCGVWTGGSSSRC
ncbi:MAG TPA: hypothetical protein VFW45_06990 [Candidatus Polarisedimenticolia bacterium]|nr:hypothetical protein [Candidatus Polarisedimenticolia bacterium]